MQEKALVWQEVDLVMKKKASSASSLRKIRKEFDDDDIDDDSEEDPTEGFESLQYAISSGSNRQLQPPQQQPLKSNVPPLNPQQSNASILNSQRSWATSTQQQPSLQTSQIHDSQSSQYQTSSPSSTTAKSIRKRKLLHLLYLTICAILLCSFAFLIESTKLMTYARTRATLVSDVLTEMNGVKPQLVEKDGIISDSSSETDTGGETHTSLAKSMPTIIELTPEQEKFNTLQSILSPSISAPESFELTHTPQYRALTFLVSTDGRNLPIPTTSSQEAKFIQRYILTVLYYAMGGEEWNHQFKFLSALDECRWNEKISVEGGQEYIGGVGGCDVNGMIQTVALWDNNLDGQLPMEIGELKSVKVMSLFSNEIHGVLPLNVANMNSLELLYLHSNNLVGDFGFMCPLQIENFRADCFGGTNANVQCSCCNVCCAKNNVHNENACYIQ
mmetsp:Transcript_732/g.956  ORF Transcript_732/g.956 Transcript_732/m.956 type:complete len:445 (-) Transcript_732:206-1540(-)